VASLADVLKLPAFQNRGNLLDLARGGLMGVTTDVLGYPVDLATMAMRPFGYNVEKPVGGSDWLADKLTSPNNSLAEIAGRTATGMITPGPEDLLRMMGVVGKAPMQELTVYHGSPHRINNVDEANPVGKFDLSKVGTGEGAQAYGHGIYLAESPDVARSYASDGGHSLLKARMLRDKAKKLRGNQSATSDDLALAERLESQADGIGNGSNLYTVDLPDEHIAKMLDWDAPLSEQPEAVRKALNFEVVKDTEPSDSKWVLKLNGEIINGFDTRKEALMSIRESTGGQLYKTLAAGQGQFIASKTLREFGIPGIKYFDGGSRKAGEGTRNFVIFDGDTAKILKRE
jgi:hypothetical protein